MITEALAGSTAMVGHAAACAVLCYGVAQGWILHETTRGSVNIQEAIDRVAHTGQTEVALHTRDRHGGQAEEIVRGAHGDGSSAGLGHGPRGAQCIPRAARAPAVDHSGVHRSTGVAFLHMGSTRRHVAPGTGGHPQRHRGGNCPGPPRLAGRPGFPLAQTPGRPPSGACGEGFSLAASPQRHPDKGARPFLQTGTVQAAPPDSGWRPEAGEAQPLPDPWILPLWYLPTDALAHATQPVKGVFPPSLPPGVAMLRSLQAGAAWVRW